MADLSITAGNIVGAAGYGFVDANAGEAVTRGLVVYTKSADSEIYKADCENASSAVSAVTGIALNDAGDGQPIRIMTSGTLGMGAIITVGTIYVLSAAGAIAPLADLASSDFLSVIGIGITSSSIMLTIINSGVEKS